MSITGPKYTELCENVIQSLDIFMDKVDQNPDQASKKSAQEKIAKFKSEIDFENLAQAEANVSDFADRSIKVIKEVYDDLIAQDIDEEESDEEGTSFINNREYDHALRASQAIMVQTLKAFNQVVSHKEELKTNGLETYLHEDWAQIQFIFLLERLDPWAISKWCQLLESGVELGLKILEVMDKSFDLYGSIYTPLFDQLIEHAQTSDALQITIQAYSVAYGAESIFHHQFEDILCTLKADYGVPKNPWRSIKRASELVDYYFYPFAEGMGVSFSAFEWDTFPLHFRVSFFRLHFIRERKLIGYYTGKLGLESFIDKPQPKCFPKTDSVLMSFRSDHGPCVGFVAEALKPYKIPITLYSSEALLESYPPFLEKIKEISVQSRGISPAIWVQDYSHIGEKEIRIPSIILKPDGIKYEIMGARNERMEARLEDYTELPFQPYGASLDGGNSFKLFSKLYQQDPSCQSFSFQFIVSEGGNYLVGDDLVCVGKDSLECARVTIEAELKELGIMEREKNLSDDEVRGFFAADMGLSSPEKIVFIEQSAYHLDVVSVIVKSGPGKPVVWVNDSVMAIDEWALYADEHEEIKEELINDEGSQSYDERIEHAIRMAGFYKQYEDAATADYEAAGFDVVRVGGKIENLNKHFPENYRTNFFNFSSMTTPSGEKIILALGSEPYFNQKFEGLVREHIGEDVKVIFCDKSISHELLALNGGLNCCIKRLGEGLRLPPKTRDE